MKPTPPSSPEVEAGSLQAGVGQHRLGRYLVKLPTPWAEANVRTLEGCDVLHTIMAKNITFDVAVFPGGGEKRCDEYLGAGLRRFDDGSQRVADTTWCGQSFRGVRIEKSKRLSENPAASIEYFATNYCGDAVCFSLGVLGPIFGDTDGSATESEIEGLRSMMFTIVFSALIQAGSLAAAPTGSAQAHAAKPPSRDAGVGLSVEDYQAHFEKGLADIFKGKVAGKFVPEDLPEGFPKHVVFGVSGADRSAPMFLATNGVGRLPQPNGVEADDNQNVELTTFADGFNPTACRILSYLGRALSLHEKGESAWKGFDTVKLFEPILGFQHFVFRPSGHIQVSGRTVTLLAVIPLTEAEYRQAANGKAREWLEQKMAEPEQRNDFVARWSKPKGKL